MNGKAPQILVVTGSSYDDWLMHHVFLPVARWLAMVSGRSAQNWARVFLVGGVLAILMSNLAIGGGITYAIDVLSDLVWIWVARQMWRQLNELEEFSDSSGDAIPFYFVSLCRYLITMRTITAFLTVFNLIMVPLGGDTWWLALGTAFMTLACFLGTTFPPRGKSLKERIAGWLRAPMKLSLAPPLPA